MAQEVEVEELKTVTITGAAVLEESEWARSFTFNNCEIPIFSALWLRAGKQSIALLAGGAGTARTGVKSGIIVCRAEGKQLRPFLFVDTHDVLVYAMAKHPFADDVVCALGPFVGAFSLQPQKGGRDIAFISRNSRWRADFSDAAVDPADRVVSALHFNHSGDTLVTGGQDGRLRLWKYPQHRLLRSIVAHDGRINSIDMASGPGGELILSVCAEQRSCRLFHLATGALLHEFRPISSARDGVPLAVRQAAFVPRPQSAASSSGKKARQQAQTQAQAVLMMNASKQGPSYVGLYDVTATVPRANADAKEMDQAQVRPLHVQLVDGRAALVKMAVVVTPSGARVAVATNSPSIYVHDVEQQMECICAQHAVHSLPSMALTFSPDARVLLSGSGDKSFALLPVAHAGNSRAFWWLLLMIALVVAFAAFAARML